MYGLYIFLSYFFGKNWNFLEKLAYTARSEKCRTGGYGLIGVQRVKKGKVLMI